MSRLLCFPLIALLLVLASCSEPTHKEDLSLNPKVHTFYYAWYGNPDQEGEYRHWNHEVLPHWSDRNWDNKGSFPGGENIGANYYPELGCYSSSDSNLIQTHMEMIKASGIGVLVMSWWGKDSPEDDDIPLYLDLAAQNGLQMAFHIEPFYRTAEAFQEELAYITKAYGNHPALYRWEGKPMYYVYDSYKLDTAAWQRLLTPEGDLSVRGNALDAVFIGLWVHEGEGPFFVKAGFDGYYTYFASDGFVYGSSRANWKALASFGKEHGLLFIPCAGPGYIDTRIRPWNGDNTKARELGAYYERQFAAAVASQPDLIGITSFNEWHEGTQIEPAIPKRIQGYEYEDYGEGVDPWFYLGKTRELVERFQ